LLSAISYEPRAMSYFCYIYPFELLHQEHLNGDSTGVYPVKFCAAETLQGISLGWNAFVLLFNRGIKSSEPYAK